MAPARRPSLTAYRVLRLGLCLLAALVVAAPAVATTLTLSQQRILNLYDITAFFGGNGEIVSKTVQGDGVLFEIQGGTIDFGKVAARTRISPMDLTPYDAFGLHFEIVSATLPVAINPFVQTGSSGLNFYESVNDTSEGEAFDATVPLAGLSELTLGYALGFQYFTLADTELPPAQDVLIYVAPLSGAEELGSVPVPVPEPGPALLVAAGLLCLGAARAGSRWHVQ